MIIDHIDVPESEFEDFLRNYPRPLMQRIDGTVTHYYDEELDKTPNHIAVAYHGTKPDGTRGKFWIARHPELLVPKSSGDGPSVDKN